MTSHILIQDLIRRLAKKHNMTIDQMKDLFESPFHVTIDAIKGANRETEEFPIIRVINFGVFYPSMKKVRIMNENFKKKYETV